MEAGQLVLAILLQLFVVTALLRHYFWRGSTEERAQRKAIRLAKRDLKKSENVYAAAIKRAEKNLVAAEKGHARAIRSSEKYLAELENPKGRPLGFFGGIALYERFIETPQGSGSLVGGHASVDTAGDLAVKSRATLTRMAAGGLLLGPLGAVLSLGFKKHKNVDKRELYLTVETPQFAGIIQCNPDKGMQARTFAAQVNTAAARAAISEPQRPAQIEAARAQLESLRSDRSTIVSAEQNLTRVRSDEQMLGTIERAKDDAVKAGARPQEAPNLARVTRDAEAQTFAFNGRRKLQKAKMFTRKVLNGAFFALVAVMGIAILWALVATLIGDSSVAPSTDKPVVEPVAASVEESSSSAEEPTYYDAQSATIGGHLIRVGMTADEIFGLLGKSGKAPTVTQGRIGPRVVHHYDLPEAFYDLAFERTRDPGPYVLVGITVYP